MEPLIQAGNEGLVHHMILYACRDGLDVDANHGLNEDCQHETMEDIVNHCYVSLFIYAIGTGVSCLCSIGPNIIISSIYKFARCGPKLQNQIDYSNIDLNKVSKSIDIKSSK